MERGPAMSSGQWLRLAMAASAVVLVALAVGAVVAPGVVLDPLLWPAVLGPAVADATNAPVAVHRGIAAGEGFPPLAYAVYAPVAVLLLGAAWLAVERLRVPVDARLVAALLPFLLLGPALSALEDAGAFCRAGTLRALGEGCEPGVFAWAVLTATLFGTVLASAVLFLALGAWLRDRAAAPGQEARVVALAMAGLVGLYLLAWLALPGEATAWAHPAAVAVAALVALGAFALLRRRGLDPVLAAPAAGGLLLLLPALALVGQWMLGAPWVPGVPGGARGPALAFTVLVPVAATALVGAVGVLGRASPLAAPLAAVPNLAIVFGHALDGVSTFVAVCRPPSEACRGASFLDLGLPAYGEQHPLSLALLGLADGWAFPLVKVALAVALVLAVDVAYRKDLQDQPALAGLLKLAVLVLGLAPGARNALRLAMGV